MNNQKQVKTVIATSIFALCLNYIGIGLVFPLFPQLCFDTSIPLLDPHTSSVERSVILGILLALMPLTQFFFSPLLGAHSDQRGRRPLLLLSLLIGFLGYCLGTYAVMQPNLFLLFLSRVIVGISTSNSSVVAAALADISSKEERASRFTLYGMATGAGMAIGPLLGATLSNTALFSWASYTAPFVAAALMTLFNFLAVLFFFPKTTRESEKKNASEYAISPYRLIRDSFLEKQLRFFFLIAFLFYFGWTFFWEFIPITLMTSINYPTNEIGYIYMTGATANVLLSLLIAKRALSKFTIKKLLPLALGLLSFCIGITGCIQNTTQLFQIILLQQIFLSCLFPLFSTYVSTNSSEETQGKSLGMLNAIKAIACSLGPLCSGLFFSLSHLAPILVGMLFICVSCLLSVQFFYVQQKESTREKTILE